MDATGALRLIDEARAPDGGVTLVGIGGHGGAGKSTLARLVAGAQVVSTDAFWDGEGFDLERLRREVVDPLRAGREAWFAAWDWAARAPAGEQRVEPRGIVVVEGVCALHADLRDAYALRLWVDAPAEVRLARGVARDGQDARATWTDVWMPREDAYVRRDRPIEAADAIVDGTAPLPRAEGSG